MKLPKVEIKKILYATDLSENAKHAFAYAVSLANLYDASILILHVLAEVPNLDSAVMGYISANKWEEIKERNREEIRKSLTGKKRDHKPIREALDQFAEDVKDASSEDFKTDETLVRSGIPADIILEEAEQRNCDMIVMGTHGHGIIGEVVMGSTAKKVLRRTNKPVLVIKLPKD